MIKILGFKFVSRRTSVPTSIPHRLHITYTLH